MIRPKIETEVSSIFITMNCKRLIVRSHRKAEETLEFKLTKPKEPFSIKPSLNLGFDSKWMSGLTSLDVYISIFIL